MGGRGKIGTFGPLVFLASAATGWPLLSSIAGDLTLTTARTTPADTNTGDGSGPGNITIQSNGSVTVSSDAAVVLNSSNSISNLGSITNNLEAGATGVFVLTTRSGAPNNITGSLSNLGGIVVTGPPTTAGLSSADVFNFGINVAGTGSFTGNITNDLTTASTGTISVGGGSSYGIAIQTSMIGSLTNNGSISMTGPKSFGIATTGRITGDVTNSGTITVGATDTVGAYFGGGVDGTILFSGALSAGTGSRLTSTNGVTVTTLAPNTATAGLWLASDVTRGLLLSGNRLTLNQELADSVAAAAATPRDSNINVVGSGPGLFIAQGGPNTTLANITIGLGTNNGGYAVKNQGNILTAGAVNGFTSSAIFIQGASSGSATLTTTLTGGLWNDKGNIQTVSKDAVATGIGIGNYGVVPRIQNDGDIFSSSQDSSFNVITGALGTKGGDAFGIRVDGLGSLGTLNNTGSIIVDAQGPTATAYGVADRSGTLTSFTNSGTIKTTIQPLTTGRTIAVDLSANTSGLSFANSGAVTGDVLLGAGNTAVALSGSAGVITGNLTYQAGATKSGNNTFTMNGGTVTGVVDLGSGTHTVSLSNGAKANGGIAQGTGTLSLTADSSQFAILGARPLNVSNATITGTSIVTFDVNNAAASLSTGILQSTGTISIGAGSKLTAAFTGIIDGQKTITVVRAGSLVLGAPLSQIATTPSSFINVANFSLSVADPNTMLLNVRRKSAAELGLGPNTTAIYNAFATAINQDTPVVTAISALQTQATFTAGVRQLMPDSSGALQQASLNNQDMVNGAIRRRLVGVAKNGMPDHAAGDVASFWIQALGDFGDQKARGEQPGFDIWGLGIAFGADAPIFDNTTNVGIGFSETWHSANLKVARKSPVEFYNTQVNLYGRYNNDAFYLAVIAGGGYNRYNQERRVTIGNLSRLAIGKWKGYEYGGGVETGYALGLAAYELTPYVRASYLKSHENGYTEKSGGTGIDLTLNARNGDNARAAAGFTLSRDFPIYYDSYVEAEVRGNYTREFMNDPHAVTARFATGPSFTNFTNPRSPNRANVGLGLAHKDSYSSVSLDYDAEISKGYLAHKAAITARFRF